MEDWFENCVCKELEIDREMVSQFMLMNGKGLNMLLKEDWLSRLPDLVGDLVFRKWNDLKKVDPNKQSAESGGTDIKKGKKSGVYFIFHRSRVIKAFLIFDENVSKVFYHCFVVG